MAPALLAGCYMGPQGELVGVQPREYWDQANPYGMNYVHFGSFTMGPSDQDVPYALNTPTMHSDLLFLFCAWSSVLKHPDVMYKIPFKIGCSNTLKYNVEKKSRNSNLTVHLGFQNP